MNHDKPIQQVWEVQFLGGWKWYPAMYWALDCTTIFCKYSKLGVDDGRRNGRCLLLQIELPPMWDTLASCCRCGEERGRGRRCGEERGCGRRRGRGGGVATGVGMEGPTGFRRLARRRQPGACCSAGERRTRANAGAGRGRGRRRARVGYRAPLQLS